MSDVPPNSVVVQLHGGLGNQMFQAAAGMALAKKLELQLVLDTSRFRSRGLRAYALEPFNLAAQVLLPRKPSLTGRAAKLGRKALGLPQRSAPLGWQGAVYTEPHFHYDQAFEALDGPVFISGYFQSPRYFATAEAEVRKAFEARNAVSERARTLAEGLRGAETVSVHVRRGDMANDPKMQAVHGTLGDYYYERAIDHVCSAAPEAQLRFFSDSPQAAQHLQEKFGGETIQGESALDDLWLMSQCSHHVTANSSFSWWGAFLGGGAGRMSVAPKQWFTDEGLEQFDVRDLYVPAWLTV